MRVETQKLDDGRMELTIEVAHRDLSDDLKRAYKRVASQLSIPGFRKGRIPPTIIDQRVGKDYIYNEMAEEIIPRLYKDAVIDENLEPIGMPEVELHQCGPNKDLIFKAKVALRPEPKLGEYKGLNVTVPSAEVSDEDLEERVGVIQGRYADIEVKDGTAEEGDYVMADYKVSIGGEEIDELAVSDYLIKIGGDDVAAEFSGAAMGKKVGEEVEFELTLPHDHPNDKYAGKDCAVNLAIKEVKEEKLPEVDDEFAKKVSEFDTLDEFKADMKKKIFEQRTVEAKEELRQQAVRAAIDNAEMEIPEEMIESELEVVLRQFGAPLREEGSDIEEYFKTLGIPKEDLEAQFRPLAVNRLEQELILDTVAEKEEIEVSSDELKEEITKGADAQGKKPEDLYMELAQSNRLPVVEGLVKRNKAIDLMAESAVPDAVEVTEYERIVKEATEARNVKRAAAAPKPDFGNLGGGDVMGGFTPPLLGDAATIEKVTEDKED